MKLAPFSSESERGYKALLASYQHQHPSTASCARLNEIYHTYRIRRRHWIPYLGDEAEDGSRGLRRASIRRHFSYDPPHPRSHHPAGAIVGHAPCSRGHQKHHIKFMR